MLNYDLALRDVKFPDGKTADIGFKSGRVIHIGAVDNADETVRCHNMLLIPAATDMHVHMRGGSQAKKEDWQSGTMSAIAGGVTMVVDQPNTVPPLTTPSRFIIRVKEAVSGACCRFAVNAGVEPDVDLHSLWDAGAMAFGELFAGPSSYGHALPPHELKKALQEIHRLGGLATIHAEMVGTNEPETLNAHNNNRTPEGEAEAVRQVCRLNTSGCQLHFCHMSSGNAIEAILEQRKVISDFTPDLKNNSGTGKISFEVTPHHLLLANQDFPPGDSRAKVNPPLRDKKTQKGLWETWDQIDVIASDHAPHTASEKAADFQDAPSGIPGVETMVPLLLAEVQKRKIPVSTFVEKVSRKPCEILGIPPAGFAPGERADFALYPKNVTRVDPGELHSRAGWSPFEGLPAIFPELVVMEGRIVYHNGEFYNQDPRWYPGRGYQAMG
ncbi:MAG: dihydroorotase [Methanomicrobiales archaeon]